MPSGTTLLNSLLALFPEDLSCRRMMGEYILYYRGKVIGGIYDDRLLVKNLDEAAACLPQVVLARPYEGAREMLLVETANDKRLLEKLFTVLHTVLPEPKKRKMK